MRACDHDALLAAYQAQQETIAQLVRRLGVLRDAVARLTVCVDILQARRMAEALSLPGEFPLVAEPAPEPESPPARASHARVTH